MIFFLVSAVVLEGYPNYVISMDAEEVIEMLIDTGLCYDYQKETEKTLLNSA